MKPNYKICMITQSSFPHDPRVRREAEILEDAGYEVDVLCIPIAGDEKIYRNGRITAYRIRKNPVSQEKMLNYLLLTLSFFIHAFFKLNILYYKRKYNVIQVHNMPEFHVFAALFQKIIGVPVVLDIHDLTPELFAEKWPKKSKYFLPPIKLFEKISCKFSNKLITVTDGCKTLLIDRGVPPEKITLVLNTANSKIFQYNINREYYKINSGAKLLYHGTVAKRFGLHIVIEAMPEIIKVIPDTKFYIYGKYDNSYKDYLEEMISLLKLENSVFLNDAVSWEELVEVMNSSDIEIVPYISNTYMNLSLSTKLFESASIGLAVVATDLKSLRDVFDDSSVQYFNDSDPLDLAIKVINFCHNAEERKNKTINAKIAVESISGEVMGKRYLTLMQQVMKVKDTNRGMGAPSVDINSVSSKKVYTND